MIRTLFLMFLFLLLIGPCMAQPPVAVVGNVEQVCAHGENQLDCAALPPPHETSYLGEISGRLKFKPKGFDYAHAVAARNDERGEGFYIFGETLGASSGPYLAFAPKAELQNPRDWQFFGLRGMAGTIAWVDYDQWKSLGNAQSDRNPGDKAKLFAQAGNCGGFQVEWNENLRRWLMLYNCGDSFVRVAQKAGGPWSAPTLIFKESESSGPELLASHDSAGPSQSESRTAIIYWEVLAGVAPQHYIYRSTLHQEGDQ